MKKLVIGVAFLGIVTSSLKLSAQDSNFDKKYRFGLRITPQPTWFSTNDKNIDAKGTRFGFGFGLNMEYKFSDVVCLVSGIGGDFEGGKYNYRNDPGTYSVYYELNETGEFTKPVNGLNIPASSVKKTTNTGYLVKSRTISTTYITIPFILKLSTSEYNGLKYFGMFGVELGVRAKALATDTYYESYTFAKDSVLPTVSSGGSQSKLDIGGFKGDAASGIIRLGLNVGLGTEWRLAGSTSLFASINYFRSFFSLMSRDSDFLLYKSTVSGGKITNNFIKQNIIMNAIRINVGFMF
jgi:hypothetical protein